MRCVENALKVPRKRSRSYVWIDVLIRGVDQMYGKYSQTARRWVACVDRCVGSTVGLASPLSNLRRRG